VAEVTRDHGSDDSAAPWPPGTYRNRIPELSHGSVALLDVDGDGRLDIYRLAQPPPDPAFVDSATPPRSPAPNRLWVQRTSGRF
jgi:hypothetical protein